MSKTMIGIDIGSSSLKLALCRGGKIVSLVEETMPDKLAWEGRIVSAEAMAEFLKKSLKDNGIRGRACTVVLPSAQVFVRKASLPMMTEEQLRLNLPYEFRDFIAEEKDKYYYDYAVLSTESDETGKPTKLNLFAAAAPKNLIQEYYDVCRWAGLRLEAVIPMEMAYINLMRAFAPKEEEQSQEECFIDVGHTGTRIYFFKGESFEALRSAERGGAAVDDLLSEQLNIDKHIAHTRKESDAEGEMELPEVRALLGEISMDVMRALNFYSYNNQDSNLKRAWICGGGERIPVLQEELRNDLNIELHSIADVIKTEFEGPLTAVCFAAIGAAEQ